MYTTRQDAWTNDEDLLLAETVIRYIREGKTQLEAFKEVAKALSRTSAACGFRWNATIRKQYHNAIDSAKEMRKNTSHHSGAAASVIDSGQVGDPIDTAILLLKKMKVNSNSVKQIEENQASKIVNQLEKENEQLRIKLQRYDDAWKEITLLWSHANEH